MQILQHLAAKAVATSTYPSLTTLASNIVAFPTSNPNTFDGPYFPDNLNVAPSATSTLTPDDPTVWYEQDWVLVMTIMLVIFSLVSAMLCLWASASSTGILSAPEPEYHYVTRTNSHGQRFAEVERNPAARRTWPGRTEARRNRETVGYARMVESAARMGVW